MTSMTIAFAADHAGVELKKLLCEEAQDMGYTLLDLGTNSSESVDYPDYAEKMAACLADQKACFGVLICGSGVGISIAANRFKHVRAALCSEAVTAHFARAHNDANVLVLGARFIGTEIAKACLQTFLTTDFDGGRHTNRVSKLNKMG